MGVWRSTGLMITLAVALSVVVGCDGGGPVPPAPPTRALVGWSETLCGTVKSVEEVRTAAGSMRTGVRNTDPATAGSVAEMYLSKAAQDLPAVRRTLSLVTPTGLPGADDYVSGLAGALNPVWPDLPAADHVFDLSTEDKLARAQRIAGVVDSIQPRLQDLPSVARAEPGLVNSYDVAPDCAGPSTQRNLVSWANSMCTAVRYTLDLPTIPFDDLLGQPGYAVYAGSVLAQYLSATSAAVQQLQDRISLLGPSGDQAADQYRTTLLGRLQAVAPRLPASQADPLDDASVDALRTQTEQVSQMVLGLLPPGPSFADIAAAQPDLAAAYGLAPECDPARPALSPRNGTDLDVCRTGTCQVEITGRGRLQIRADTVDVQVAAGWTTILGTAGLVSAKPGTDTGFDEADGATVHFAVVGMTGDTIVLEIRGE